MKKGFTIQLLNKNNGQAVRRKWFLTVTAAQAWLDWQYPHWKEMYDMEIFCDQEGESPPLFLRARVRSARANFSQPQAR